MDTLSRWMDTALTQWECSIFFDFLNLKNPGCSLAQNLYPFISKVYPFGEFNGTERFFLFSVLARWTKDAFSHILVVSEYLWTENTFDFNFFQAWFINRKGIVKVVRVKEKKHDALSLSPFSCLKTCFSTFSRRCHSKTQIFESCNKNYV